MLIFIVDWWHEDYLTFLDWPCHMLSWYVIVQGFKLVLSQESQVRWSSSKVKCEECRFKQVTHIRQNFKVH